MIQNGEEGLALNGEKETSYMYKCGVRVEVVERGVPIRHWICLADETCR
ncbi:hypothetical protein F442_19188 [Phytophthora nicotianae P10297]|uniref:Uncharacterized protein n=3 Tax=Phytophthora nicotianae TaxID=4792 RepID=W2QX57_PHYN3|nr:hypothetical protein PPTG_21695 [Phytophthora nicotianae INRA-310]ETN17782.1 hypothetical protein PPTG_21695 [Phytophthora nicotianae INRA-310]ETO62796.1 hypothetical protein F444_19369 [Phytophthora nicotianae P1976]ETP32036.1 hypothetical protein F442_19188 [Phytophthora nicotianae P10297]